MPRRGLTRQGVAVVGAGLVAIVIGRVFAIVELFVIAAACFASVAAGLAYVWIRHPRVEASRWIHPSVLVAGDTGHVDIRLRHDGRITSAPFVLEEPVVRTMTEDHVARLPVAALRAGTVSSSGYRVPTTTRGVIGLGPLRLITHDALGIARSVTPIVGTDEIVVAPRTLPIDMPELGRGPLGRSLLESSRRLGPGDFHGLREYASGDEPRSIHWRASARSDALMVKEFTVEGLHRCTVVFDPAPAAHASTAGFERGVTAAASLVASAMRAGLNTRFVTAGGIDLRGPEVVHNTQRVLARIEPNDAAIAAFDTDMADGLVLLVVITGSPLAASWRVARSMSDPAVTKVLVTTSESPGRTRLAVPARSDEEFVAAWQSLVGQPSTGHITHATHAEATHAGATAVPS